MEVFFIILILFTKIFRTKLSMKTRKSFFIRWLLFRDEEQPQEEQSVIDIQHIQSGNNRRVSSLEEANLWMREVEAKQDETQDADDLLLFNKKTL